MTYAIFKQQIVDFFDKVEIINKENYSSFYTGMMKIIKNFENYNIKDLDREDFEIKRYFIHRIAELFLQNYDNFLGISKNKISSIKFINVLITKLKHLIESKETITIDDYLFYVYAREYFVKRIEFDWKMMW